MYLVVFYDYETGVYCGMQQLETLKACYDLIDDAYDDYDCVIYKKV